MDAITKTKLKEYIEEFKQKQLIEADIRTAIQEFKHYKQVNKKFTDHLKTLGYHAYIVKDHSHKLRVSKNGANFGSQFAVEVYVYGQDLTWDKILHELDRCAHKEQEEKYTKRLEMFDHDIAQLKEIAAYLKEKEKIVEGFSFYRLNHVLDDCIRNSLDER